MTEVQVQLGESSRKRHQRLSSDGHCPGGCGNPSCSLKRVTGEEEDEEGKGDSVVRWWYVRLDSDSEPFDSDEPESLKNESVYSLQERETDIAHDSSDSENRWRQSHLNEYEVASLQSGNEQNPFSYSSDDESSYSTEEGLVITKVAHEGISIEYFADSSSGMDSSDESSDPELLPQDKWSCLRCKQKNQPIPRYCQHCFAVRKQWFPPRPKAHKKRRHEAINLENMTTLPLIQITPNLSIPDLSEMKGNPIAESIQRSFNESVSRFASMTDEERLCQLKETIQRNKLVQAHSEKQLEEHRKDQVIKNAMLPAEEDVCPASSSKLETGSGGKKSCQGSRKSASKARSLSSKSSAISSEDTSSKKEKEEVEMRPELFGKDPDFQDKVSNYLTNYVSPVLDTPPQSQDSDYALDGPSSHLPNCDTLDSKDVVDSEDVVDGIRPKTAEAKFNSFSSLPAVKVCSICEENEVNTAFIHARSGHLCACFSCAKQVYAAKGQCPICQRKAKSVCKIYS